MKKWVSAVGTAVLFSGAVTVWFGYKPDKLVISGLFFLAGARGLEQLLEKRR